MAGVLKREKANTVGENRARTKDKHYVSEKKSSNWEKRVLSRRELHGCEVCSAAAAAFVRS